MVVDVGAEDRLAQEGRTPRGPLAQLEGHERLISPHPSTGTRVQTLIARIQLKHRAPLGANQVEGAIGDHLQDRGEVQGGD